MWGGGGESTEAAMGVFRDREREREIEQRLVSACLKKGEVVLNGGRRFGQRSEIRKSK